MTAVEQKLACSVCFSYAWVYSSVSGKFCGKCDSRGRLSRGDLCHALVQLRACEPGVKFLSDYGEKLAYQCWGISDDAVGMNWLGLKLGVPGWAKNVAAKAWAVSGLPLPKRADIIRANTDFYKDIEFRLCGVIQDGIANGGPRP